MYYCGPAALAKTLKVKTLAATTKNVQFTFAKEHFVRRPCSPIHTLTLPPSDLSMELAEIELCVLPLRMLPRRKKSECERGAEEGGKGTGVSGEIIRVQHSKVHRSIHASLEPPLRDAVLGDDPDDCSPARVRISVHRVQ